MTKLKAAVAVGLLLAGVYAAIAFAGDGHRRHGTTTVTQTITAPGQTVTVDGSSSSASSSATSNPSIVVNVQPGQVVVTRTVTKTAVIRRWCTRQRHGWRCTALRPAP